MITSCKEGESAYEWHERRHGVFTAHLIDGLTHPNSLRPTRNKEGVRPVRSNHHDVPGSAFQEREALEDILQDLFGDLGPTEGLAP